MLHIAEPHTQTLEEARRRMREMFERLRREHAARAEGLTERWTGDSAEFRLAVSGMQFAGTLAVEPRQVVLHLELPMMAMLFAGAIEAHMRVELRAALG